MFKNSLSAESFRTKKKREKEIAKPIKESENGKVAIPSMNK
jgi:hypothetical protein